MTDGFFKIKHSDSKTTLKLKGDFNSNNIFRIQQVIIITRSYHDELLELDMSEVEAIDVQAMALISINLKELRDSGKSTSVTGLNGNNLNLAEELGLQFITKIK